MSNEKRGPLCGVTILDLTCVLSGPFGTSWLSDMGAEVIKVENPNGGDYTRQAGPFVNGYSNYFATVNRNKKTITLNLKDPKGKEMFLELVKQVDVVTENFKPGTMEKLGVGYDVLKKINPRLVFASISGYGQTGPYSHRPGYDVVSQAMGGIMSYTGFPENGPSKCGPSIGDITAGMNLCMGVLAGLYKANATGTGERVELALVDSVLALTTQDYIDYGHTKNLPQQLGNNYSLWCPYGTYKAKDRYYTIGVGTEKHWTDFCLKVLEKPELTEDPRFAGQTERVHNRELVDAHINQWAGNLPAAEVVDKINAAGIPAAIVYDFADIEADENFTVHRQMIKKMHHPEMGEILYINNPLRFTESGQREPVPAAPLGAFNEEIYGKYLSLSPEEVAKLKESGTI